MDRARRAPTRSSPNLNPETWDQDLAEIEPGGYLFYDSTKPLPPSKFRDDITVIGAPLTAICNREYTDARQRQLFKNIIYLGALSALLDIDVAAIERLIGEQFRGKDSLIKPNLHALQLGREWALSEHECPIGLRLQRVDKVGERIFMNGNDAAALGCVFGGATVAAWYPITPSSSLAEAFAAHCNRYRRDPETKKKRYAIIQAEDELASIGIVIGAAWNGARAFTATAGPGISLMQEFIGLAYFAEIPAVIFDVQRGSPSTGMPTRTQQADILSCAFASHGDTKHVLLFPEDPRESFSFAAEALDLADRLQTPVFVMLDLDIGMNRTYPGTHPTRGAFFTRGTSKDRYARYSEEGPDYVDNMQRLLRKFETAKRLVPRPIKRAAPERTGLGALYFGSTAPAMAEALEALEKRGIRLDTMRIRGFPFHDDILDFVAGHERIFVVEQNRDAQLRTLLMSEGDIDPARLVPILHYDGTPITARFIVKAIADMLAVVTLAPLKKALP